jgi:hypothetical protein
MRIPELVIAVLLGLLGARSLVHWLRRPVDSSDPADHALFALHVTARVGMWLTLAGLFVILAVVGTTDPVSGREIPAVGQAFVDAAREYAWIYPVLVGIAAVQFVTGWFLGRRTPRSPGPVTPSSPDRPGGGAAR